MKNLKKVLALVVVLTMVLTTVAFASYPDVDAKADYAGAVELLSALKVLQGDDTGNFNPDNTITRAEYAAVVCRALGLENSANSAKGATQFNDVAADHWASGYINLASQQGIVNGKGNGVFDPEGNVTYAEAVKMLVVALGYEPMASQKGGYPTGYLTVANSSKITANVSANGTDSAALRSTVAQLTANAMAVPVMDQTGYGTDTTFEVLDDYDNYQTLLTNMDIYIATGVVGKTDTTSDKVHFTLTESSDDFEFGCNSKGEDNLVKGTNDGKDFKINGSNIEQYYQQNVDAYVYKENKSDYSVIIAVPSGIGETLTINASDLKDDTATIAAKKDTAIEYYETKDSTKSTKIYCAGSADTTVYVNGIEVDEVSDLAVYSNSDATIQFVENSDDKYYDVVLITVYEHQIVDEVDTAKEKITFLGGDSVKFDSTDADQKAILQNKDGSTIALSDFKENDVLAIEVGTLKSTSGTSPMPKDAKNFSSSGSENKITITNLGANTVTGSITESDDDYIYIDGTSYEYNGTFADGNYSDVFDSNDDAKLGTEGTFYLGITGKVVGFDGTSGANGKYGYILQAAKNTSTSFDENSWQIKMLTETDGIVTFDVYKTLSYDGVSYSKDTNKTEIASALGTYDSSFKTNVDKRVVEYKLTSDGEIKSIDHYSDVIANGTVESKETYKESTGKLGSKILADDVVIFNIDYSDIDDPTAYTISYLVDDTDYAGYIADKDDSEYGVFVMTNGGCKFDAEGALNIATNVTKTKYNDDDAYKVTYYTKGEEDAKTAIFTDTDSSAQNGSKSYTTLTKGSAFVINADNEGLVSDYAIFGNIASQTLSVDDSVIASAYAGDYMNNSKYDDGAAYIYGYIKETTKKSGKTYITVVTKGGVERDVVVSSTTNQYSYNDASKNNIKIEVGDWQTQDVDVLGEEDDVTYCSYIFVKLYDGDAIDVYTFNQRVKLTDATAALGSATVAETTPAVETPVVDEAPVIVPEAPIDFE